MSRCQNCSRKSDSYVCKKCLELKKLILRRNLKNFGYDKERRIRTKRSA